MSDIKTSRRLVGAQSPDRDEAEFYPTPRNAIEGLLAVETFSGTVWEPCAGKGHLVRVLTERHMDVFASDLHDYGAEAVKGTVAGIDFLQNGKTHKKVRDFMTSRKVDIITNPPFTMLDRYHVKQFVQQLRDHSNGKVAILARLHVLEGAERKKELFDVWPPSRVWVFSERLKFERGGKPLSQPEGGRKNRGGLMAFCWLVWDHADATGETRVGWI